MTIQWLGTPASFLGQTVSPTIVTQVQEALNREYALRGSSTRVAVSGSLDQATCTALRTLGGNPSDPGLLTLVNSWGTQLQAGCVAFGGPPVATPYPWNARSEITRALQGRINAELAARGLCTLGDPDGILGPQTCEAGRYLRDQGAQITGLSQALANCQTFDSAWVPNPPCAGAVQPPPVQPPECPEGQQVFFNADTAEFECVPAAPGVRAAGMGAGSGFVALAVLAALVAGYFVLQT
jgi:hypothetical protein